MDAQPKTDPVLIPYKAPHWAQCLKYLPTFKVQLAHLNTPIHKWCLPGVPEYFSVHIKRDDMTGSTLSGNKIRSFEFLLADVIDKGCRHVITSGETCSNHCRTLAVACAQLGLTSHMLLQTDVKKVSELPCSGNLLLDRLCGAHIYIVPKPFSFNTELLPREEQLAENIKRQTGESAYMIDIIESYKIAVFGYISAFEEIMSQGVHENFDDIVVTLASGVTAAGLAIANFLTGSKLKVHCIDAMNDVDVNVFYENMEKLLHDVGLHSVRCEDIIDVMDGHLGVGYTLSTTEELEFIRDVCVKTGVLIDPIYSGKGALGLVKELRQNPHRFQGNRILFIHTGGMFELFDGRMDPTLKQPESTSNKIKLWQNKEAYPFC